MLESLPATADCLFSPGGAASAGLGSNPFPCYTVMSVPAVGESGLRTGVCVCVYVGSCVRTFPPAAADSNHQPAVMYKPR